MVNFFEEIWEEIEDFVEDFAEHLFKFTPAHAPIKSREILVNGTLTLVRPAYIFAERIDNSLKLLFGASIIISAITASFLGFTSLSELLDTLIFTIPGRIVMGMIGLSTLITSLWKLLHLDKKQ